MRIVHTEASCGWGGQEIRILEESRGLIERGHDVLVLCPAESHIYREGPSRSVRTVPLPIGRKNLRGVLAMRRWLAAHAVDVINTHSSTDSWLAALACRTLRNPPAIVRTRHISAPIPDNLPTRWLYATAAAHVVTTGESLRRHLIEKVGVPAAHVTSVPTGIDPARFHPDDKAAAKAALGLNPATRYLGIVATLRSWKGHLYLLEAFARTQLPGWVLLIVGDGPMRAKVEAKIAETNLGERVKLVGQQQRPEDWLRALDIFVLPSYANEGVPQAVLQAMFSGLPIVTTPVGAILEAVTDGKTALVVPPKDVMALANGMTLLARHPEMRSELGAAGRAHAVANFSLTTMLDRMERIFSSSCMRVAIENRATPP